MIRLWRDPLFVVAQLEARLDGIDARDARQSASGAESLRVLYAPAPISYAFLMCTNLE